MSDNPSPAKFARRASVSIAVAAVLTCALVLPGQVTAWLLADARTFGDLTDAMTVHSVLMLTVGGLTLLSWVVAAVTFFRWLTRYHAAVARQPEVALRYRRDWVVAAWFLPVGNLVIPGLVAADVARAGGVRRPGLVVWSWWVSFVAAVAALVLPTVESGAGRKQSVGFFTFGDAIDPEFRADLIAFHRPQYDQVLPAFALLLVAAALAIAMVRAFTAAQAGHQDLDTGPVSPQFLPLRQLSRAAIGAVVGVTVVLLSPAWLPDSALHVGDASGNTDAAACDPGQGNVAAPCLGAYTDADSGREAVAVAAVVVDDARFDPTTVPGLVAWWLLVGGAASFVWWLARARRNLDGFPDAKPRWRAGWSWGAWFVPGAGPVIGALVVSDIARESHPSDPGGGGAIGTPARYEAVRLVWACAVLAMVWPFTYPPLWPAPLVPPTVGWLPTTIVLGFAALLAIAVIRRVTAAQHRRTVAEPPAPPEA